MPLPIAFTNVDLSSTLQTLYTTAYTGLWNTTAGAFTINNAATGTGNFVIGGGQVGYQQALNQWQALGNQQQLYYDYLPMLQGQGLGALQGAGLQMANPAAAAPHSGDWRPAVTRARALLEQALSEEELKEMRERQRITVIGGRSGRRYQIHLTQRHGNIYEMAGDVAVRKYCVSPAIDDGMLPDADCFLGQKLFLEMDELAFIRKANVTPLDRNGNHTMYSVPGDQALANGLVPPLDLPLERAA